MDGLPAPVEGADIPVRQEETPQATTEKEAAVAPPESRGSEEAEKPPPEDKPRDLPKEARETGAEMAEELAVPSSTEVQASSQVNQPREEVPGVVVSPLTFKARAWSQRRDLERERVLKKAA